MDPVDVPPNEDTIDGARSFTRRHLAPSNPILESQQDEVYWMGRPRCGKAVIINNITFDKCTGMKERKGTDRDADLMYAELQKIGFDIDLYENVSAAGILNIMKRESAADHSEANCFACILLSHGDNGVFYGTDKTLKLDDIFALFRGDVCASLLGKPKLFFIQACRGSSLMDGTDLVDSGLDTTDSSYKIPSEADFLMAYSTVPGYFSWRNSNNGSWFMQSLADVLRKEAMQLDLLRLMTRVSRKVSEYESNAAGCWGGKKQVPQLVSTLTRDLYFPRIK